MNHNELIAQIELDVGEGFEFTTDQAEVLSTYHDGSGRVAVGAGAGTGKTTTLTRVVAEAIIRSCSPDLDDVEHNPFADILVTTFSRDAAGQLKSTIKDVLTTHETENDSEFDQAIWRWIETDSNIGTIDSVFQDMLREVATEVSVAPNFDIRDQLETEELREDIIREFEDDPKLSVAVDRVGEELSDDSEVAEFIYEIQQKLREFCYEFDGETTMFSEQFCEELHQGYEPPFDESDIIDIVDTLTAATRADIESPDSQTLSRIEDDYRANVSFAEAVEDLVDAFEAEYDERSRQNGALSYKDVPYILWKYLESEAGTEYVYSLQRRFSHVFIDEFQDTSYAQCRILSRLISNEPPQTKVLVIGDVKQSIYGWRSADPQIFANILEHAGRSSQEPDQYLEATNWTRTELETNFRSHPHIVRAVNHIFSQVFTDPGRGDVGGFTVDYRPLRAFRDESQAESPHVHVIPLGDVNATPWRQREPDRVAEIIHGLLEESELEIVDEGTAGEDDETKSKLRSAEAGDITLLFRGRYRMEGFRAALDRHGIENAVVADRGLFQAEEVGFLIDVLDWFANPHSKESLLRILRSPVTALTDETLRYITSRKLNLSKALEQWTAGELPETDRSRLKMLLDLRSDLRWDREGQKVTLVQKIIQHTAIETILLTGDDARQKYGNLWTLIEVIRDWEEEELLPYREFVRRLRRYQSNASEGSGEFEVAQVADSKSDSTVKLRTVHSAKGLEFNIVVLADVLAGPGGDPTGEAQLQLRGRGRRELVLHPRIAGSPVEYSSGPGSYWIHPEDTGSIWVSTSRNDYGRLQHPHPFNAALADQFAEYWRLFYVAVTRAADHLILTLGNSVNQGQWTKWGAALNDYLQDGDAWTSSQTLQRLRGEHPEEADLSLPIGVGELSQADEITASPLELPALDDLEESQTALEDSQHDQAESEQDGIQQWEGVEFAPRRLNPSTLHDIIACPRRYQYRALQEVSEARADTPPGTDHPDSMSPQEWGTTIHHALELYHLDYREGRLGSADSEFGTFLRSQPTVRFDLEDVVSRYRSTMTWEDVSQADQMLPEFELSAMHPRTPQVHITGYVDLLYVNDDEWWVIDFKAGDVAPEGSYIARQYRWQLATYAWLLQEEYDIDVAGARIVYVKNGVEKEYDIEWGEFATYLRQLPDRLTVDTGEGLQPRPDPDPEQVALDDLPPESRCGTCPFTSICDAWSL